MQFMCDVSLHNGGEDGYTLDCWPADWWYGEDMYDDDWECQRGCWANEPEYEDDCEQHDYDDLECEEVSSGPWWSEEYVCHFNHCDDWEDDWEEDWGTYDLQGECDSV